MKKVVTLILPFEDIILNYLLDNPLYSIIKMDKYPSVKTLDIMVYVEYEDKSELEFDEIYAIARVSNMMKLIISKFKASDFDEEGNMTTQRDYTDCAFVLAEELSNLGITPKDLGLDEGSNIKHLDYYEMVSMITRNSLGRILEKRKKKIFNDDELYEIDPDYGYEGESEFPIPSEKTTRKRKITTTKKKTTTTKKSSGKKAEGSLKDEQNNRRTSK